MVVSAPCFVGFELEGTIDVCAAPPGYSRAVQSPPRNRDSSVLQRLASFPAFLPADPLFVSSKGEKRMRHMTDGLAISTLKKH